MDILITHRTLALGPVAFCPKGFLWCGFLDGAVWDPLARGAGISFGLRDAEVGRGAGGLSGGADLEDALRDGAGGRTFLTGSCEGFVSGGV